MITVYRLLLFLDKLIFRPEQPCWKFLNKEKARPLTCSQSSNSGDWATSMTVIRSTPAHQVWRKPFRCKPVWLGCYSGPRLTQSPIYTSDEITTEFVSGIIGHREATDSATCWCFVAFESPFYPCFSSVMEWQGSNPAYELRRPYGSNGNRAETTAISPKRAAQTYRGTALAVFPDDATKAETMPIKRLKATAMPLPVAR